MANPELHYAQTKRELELLKNVKRNLGVLYSELRVRLSGQQFTIHTEKEADMVLDVYRDYFRK